MNRRGDCPTWAKATGMKCAAGTIGGNRDDMIWKTKAP